MLFGFCMGIGFVKGDVASRTIFDAVCASGYDYVELHLSALAALTDAEFAALKAELDEKNMPMRACCIFFPPEVALVGPKQDLAEIRAYAEHALSRAKKLGAETAVFGNGGARKVPDDMSHEAAFDDLRRVAEVLDEVAGTHGITITVEPLNQKETNIILCFKDAVALAHGLTHVTAMCDWYHMVAEGDTMDAPLSEPDQMQHLHIARPDVRMIPAPTDELSEYADFVKAIKFMGYDKKLSVEGRLAATEPAAIHDEIRACLAVLRQLFND